jgi:hypothetical protein
MSPDRRGVLLLRLLILFGFVGLVVVFEFYGITQFESLGQQFTMLFDPEPAAAPVALEQDNNLFATTVTRFTNDGSINVTIPSNCGDLLQRPEQKLLNVDRVFQKCHYFSDKRRNTAPQCLQFLKENEFETLRNGSYSCTPENPMIIHTFWHGEITDKVALMIKSFLFTQPLNCARLKVWFAEFNQSAIAENSYVPQFQRFVENGVVEFKSFTFDEQFMLYGENHSVEDLIMQQCSKDIFHCSKESLSPQAFYRSFSDLVRLILLYNFGGIYIDMDTILLRDLSPLYYAPDEFSCNWGAERNRMNTAFFKMSLHSEKAKILITEGLKMQSFHPLKFNEYLSWHRRRLLMLPNVLFDPIWMSYDLSKLKWKMHPHMLNYEQPWQVRHENYMLDRFFEGAYTFHWHNHWDAKIVRGSWMWMWENAYNEFLQGTHSNRYGEAAAQFY